MKFSDMKLVAKNAVKAYFVRNWTTEDLLNNGEIPKHAYTSLNRVYFTLFFAMESFTFGSILHLICEAGGRFTVLYSVASLLGLYFTSPLRVRTRVSLLMFAACNLGASFGLFIEHLFGMNQIHFVSLLVPLTLGIGAIWFGSLFTRERSEIYLVCRIYSWGLMFSTLAATNSKFIDSHGAHWMVKVSIVFVALFMGYIVVYSQEILYDAHFGEINFVNRTLSFLFRLPGIVVHAARLCLSA